MTRTLSVLLVLGLAAPLLADDPPPADAASSEAAEAPKAEPAADSRIHTGFKIRRIDFGVSGVETDTASSRFREYRAVPTGVVLPFLRFAGDDKFFYDVAAWNVLQRDARYRAYAEPGPFEITAEYQKIPHSFGNNARSILQDVGNGNLAAADTIQQANQAALERQFATARTGINFAFLNGLIQPSLAGSRTFDLALSRESGKLDVNLTKDKPVEVHLTYFHEKRRGNRASGTSFGFSNVVETPEPIDYRTQDLGINAEWTRSWGLVRGSFRYNEFTNAIQVQAFDNPFRATSATDGSAYTAPGSGSIGGASFGALALPPDSKSVTGSAGFLVKFAGRSRFSTDASVGQWTQDSAFIPFSTNTAIVSPVNATDPNALPVRSLDGKIKIFSLSSNLTSRPADHLYLAARYRRYDLSNDTPRVEFHEGYVRFDAVWEEIPRISVPYGYTTDNARLSAAYDFGPVTLEGGYKYDKWDRTFRETRKTTQNVLYAKADLRASDWAVLRGTVETGSRTFDGEYDTGASEHASYLEAEALANLPALRRFDQAEKDVDRYGANLLLTPGGGDVSLTLSYLKGKDDYTKGAVDLGYGLLTSESDAFSAEADYTPTERFNVFGFYTRENISTFQRGRQSGATVSTNPLDDWTVEIDDKVDSVGGGTTLGIVKEKVDLKLWGTYQKVDGNNDISADPNGAPGRARTATGGIADIPLFDDTKLYTLSADLAWKVTAAWTLALGGWYEQYELRDSNTSDIPNYVPGSLFLAAEDSDYKAHVVYVRASYVW